MGPLDASLFNFQLSTIQLSTDSTTPVIDSGLPYGVTDHPLLERAKTAPETPGVYRFQDLRGKDLYVGKARNLRRRVLSYFGRSDLPERTMAMLDRAAATRLHGDRQRGRGLHPREHPHQAAAAAIQRAAQGRQDLPLHQAHHRRGVAAGGVHPAGAGRRSQLLRPLHGPAHGAPADGPGADPLPGSHLPDRDRRPAATTVPLLPHEGVPRTVCRGPDHRRGVCRGGPGRPALPVGSPPRAVWGGSSPACGRRPSGRTSSWQPVTGISPRWCGGWTNARTWTCPGVATPTSSPPTATARMRPSAFCPIAPASSWTSASTTSRGSATSAGPSCWSPSQPSFTSRTRRCRGRWRRRRRWIRRTPTCSAPTSSHLKGRKVRVACTPAGARARGESSWPGTTRDRRSSCDSARR